MIRSPGRSSSGRGVWLTLVPIAAIALVLAGCTSGGGTGDPKPSSSSSALQAPTSAQTEATRQQLLQLGHVTSADLSYQKKSFGNPAFTSATIESDQADPKALTATLDDALRTLWSTGGFDLGMVNFVVKNPASGTGVDATALGFDVASIGSVDLEARYGPRGQA